MPATTAVGTEERSGPDTLAPGTWQKPMLVGPITWCVRRLRISVVQVTAGFLFAGRLVRARVEAESLHQHPLRGHRGDAHGKHRTAVSLVVVRPDGCACRLFDGGEARRSSGDDRGRRGRGGAAPVGHGESAGGQCAHHHEGGPRPR